MPQRVVDSVVEHLQLEARTSARRTEALSPETRELFCRSASVLGRPRRTEALSPETRKLFRRSASVLGRPGLKEAPSPKSCELLR